MTALAYLLLTVPFHISPDNFIVDEGYFYLQIARNIASGYGSTFNRVMPTNGYHPLWMLVCICAAYCTKSSTLLVQVVAAISDMLVLLSIYLLYDICEVLRIKGATAGVAVIAFMTTTIGIWRMLEADLALTLQLAILALLVRLRHRGQGLSVVCGLSVGCLLGLALLARLDLIFFVFMVCIYVVFYLGEETHSGRPRLRALKALSVGAACCLTVCPYLYWNYREFGHIVPISGAIKSTFLGGFHVPLFCLPVIIACALNCVRFARRRGSQFAAVTAILSVSALLQLTYSILFGYIAAWYLTTGYLSVALCATWLFADWLEKSRFPAKQNAWSGAVAFSVLLSLAVLRLISNFTYTRLMTGDVSFRRDYVEPKRALAESLRHMLPEGSRIYIFDGPGGVAYYSGMSIVPVDGLVCDYSYNAQLLADGVSKYMTDERIDYVIAPVMRGDQSYVGSELNTRRMASGQVFEIFTPLHHRSAGDFVVGDGDMVATFATIVPELEPSAPRIALWRVKHEGF